MSITLAVVLCALSAICGYWLGYRRAQKFSDELVNSTDAVVDRLTSLAERAQQKLERESEVR